MNTEFGYVLGGFALLSLIGLLLVSAYTFLFLRIFKQKTSKKTLIAVGVLTVIWLLCTLVSVMFLSNFGVVPFSITLTLLLLGSGYGFSRKILNLRLKQAVFYSLGFSVIINPVWYFLF